MRSCIYNAMKDMMPTKPLTTLFRFAKCFSMQEAGLRKMCEAALRQAPDATHALKHVSMVGARYSSPNILSTMDREILFTSFKGLLEAGVAIDPDFEIDIVNFEYGRDFLAEDTPTDLVLGCYIFDTGASSQKRQSVDKTLFYSSLKAQEYNKQLPHGGYRFDGECSTIRSPQSYEDTAWYDRIQRGNVKAVVNNSPCALDTRRFCGDGYRTLALSPLTEDYEDRCFDFLFQDHYFSEIKPRLNTTSELGRALLGEGGVALNAVKKYGL
jgi:hypothetical protein